MDPAVKFLVTFLLVQFLLIEKSLQKVVLEVSNGSQYPAEITKIDFENGIGHLEIRDVFFDIEDLVSNRLQFLPAGTIRIGLHSNGWNILKKEDGVIEKWLEFSVLTNTLTEAPPSSKDRPGVIMTFDLGNWVTLIDPSNVETKVYVCAHEHDIIFVPPGTKNGEFRQQISDELSNLFMTVTSANTVSIKSSSVLGRVLMMAVFQSPTSTVEQILHSDTVKASEITSVLRLQFETKQWLPQCENFYGVKVDDYFYARFLRETKFSFDIAKKMLKEYIDFRKSDKHNFDLWSTYKSPDQFQVAFIKKILNENKQPVFIIELGNLHFDKFFEKGDNPIQKLITFGHFLLHQLECVSEETRSKKNVIKISVIVDFKNVNWPKALNTSDTNPLKEALSMVSKYYPQVFDVAIAVNPCKGSDYVLKALGACTTYILTNTTDQVSAYINSKSLPVEYGGEKTQLADLMGSQDIATSTAEIGLQESKQETSGDSTPLIGDSIFYYVDLD